MTCYRALRPARYKTSTPSLAEETADHGREDHEEDAEATASAFMPIVAAAAAYSDSDIGDGDDSDIDDPLPLFRRGRNNVLLSDSE